MAKKEIRLYKCSECGYQSQTFMGKCPKCGSWGTLEQEAQPAVSHGPLNEPVCAAVPISGLDVEEQERIPSGIDELDRVLGGGWVRGGVTLLGGEPGVGKSTLLLQVCAEMAKRGERVIYISGEESSGQLALRGRRLGLMTPGLDLLCESDLPSSLAAAEKYGYGFMVIDSVQAFRADSESGWAGSPNQVKGVAAMAVDTAKRCSIPTVLVGHITKTGTDSGAEAARAPRRRRPALLWRARTLRTACCAPRKTATAAPRSSESSKCPTRGSPP